MAKAGPVQERINRVDLSLYLGVMHFYACQKVAESFEQEMQAAKNKTGIAQKFAHSISNRAWAGDWSSDDKGDALAWWMGARAYEIEIRDKLVSMFSAGELKDFPMQKFTG